MRRVIGIDVHRTFGEVVIWERGVLRHVGRVEMTRTALEGFGKGLELTDEVVIEGEADQRGVRWTDRPPNATQWRYRGCCRPSWRGW